MTTIDVTEMQKGHFFSEMSHYQYTGRSSKSGTGEFIHLETGETVNLGKSYIENLLVSAEQYHKEVTVGKEDKFWTAKNVADYQAGKSVSTTEKLDGPPVVGQLRVKGIRTIWEELHSQHVFAVSYGTQAKKFTKKDQDAYVTKKVAEIIAKNGKPKTGFNKSELNAYVQSVLEEAVKVDIQPTAGERILRGYKVQFASRDGKYKCVDLDLDKGNNVRPVNINTINWLLYNGVLYTVK